MYNLNNVYIEGFPKVIGCIDGTQIPIQAPHECEPDYVNRKCGHSMNVQVGNDIFKNNFMYDNQSFI